MDHQTKRHPRNMNRFWCVSLQAIFTNKYLFFSLFSCLSGGQRRSNRILSEVARRCQSHMMEPKMPSDHVHCQALDRKLHTVSVQFSSVAQLCPTLCDPMDCSMCLPCPSSTPGAYLNSCPSSWWCHPTISSSVVPFSYCLQSFPASGSFPMSQFLTSGGQSVGVSASASVLPMNIQDWFPLGKTG